MSKQTYLKRAFCRYTSFVLMLCLVPSASEAHSLQPEAVAEVKHGCHFKHFIIEDIFKPGIANRCQLAKKDLVRFIVFPENEPINSSPWFSLKITQGHGPLNIRIEYIGSKHRYWPKISYDGRHWARLGKRQLKIIDGGKALEMRLDVARLPVWLASQEVIDVNSYDQWLNDLAASINTPVSRHVIGKSLDGQALWMLQTNPNLKRTAVLVGRQHPPEVTGAIGMKHFVERLFEGAKPAACSKRSKLCQFFHETNLVIVPLLNPDGVARGHWRHNRGGVDLNRDWGSFQQPETQAIKNLLDSISKQGKNVFLFLDFHSTKKNMFYTQPNHLAARLGHFSKRWLNKAAARGAYDFQQKGTHNENLLTSKRYMNRRYGIPAITYEIGDETNRDKIRSSARIFADTLAETIYEDQK